MAIRSVFNANDSQVLINDSSETSEVTSACCYKSKIELRSAQKKYLTATRGDKHAQSYPPEEIVSNVKIEPNDSKLELQIALKKARRLKLQEAVTESKNNVEKDFEREMIKEKKCQEEEGKRGAWNEVKIVDETDELNRHPVRALSLLQQKQKEMQSPFMVLSGIKQT